MGINYKSEMERLDAFQPGSNSEFWQPKAGQFKVRALSELEDSEPSKKFPDKKQAKLAIVVEEKEYTWTMSVGVSPASLYGQLCHLAVMKGGKLTGVDFTVVVTSDGKKRNFTIVNV